MRPARLNQPPGANSRHVRFGRLGSSGVAAVAQEGCRRKEYLDMKTIRLFAALATFLVVWIAVAILLGLASRAMFPGFDSDIPVLGVNWATLPGSALGVLAGYRVFRIFGRGRPRKSTQ